jgi:hypothetical protein
MEVIIRHSNYSKIPEKGFPRAGQEDGSMFEQLDDPKLAGQKSWKERVTEGVVILLVSGAVIGLLVYALVVIE